MRSNPSNGGNHEIMYAIATLFMQHNNTASSQNRHSYHVMMISLPEIFVAKRLIFIEKKVKNAIKTMTFDRKLGILTQFSNLLLFLHT